MVIINDRRHSTALPAAEDLLPEHAFRHGRTYDSYLATEPDRRVFASSDAPGSVAYVQEGRFLQVAGGLLAAEEHHANLLADFLAFARRQRFFVTFYNLMADDLPLFREHGFQVTKWGEEALIDLDACSWQGKAYEWVRRQSNYCQRKGLAISEYIPGMIGGSEEARLEREMRSVAGQALASRPQRREVRFMEGSFDPENLGHRRMFVARAAGGEGRVESLLVCNPGESGALWSFELYRYRRDAVRGAVPFLMHQVMQQLKREGAQRVSLCLIPGQNCGRPLEGDSRLTRWALMIGSRYFNFIFDTAGTAYFKSRFRPRYEPRYIAAWPRQTLSSAWAFVRATGVLELDYGKTLRLAAGGVARAGRKLVSPASARDV